MLGKVLGDLGDDPLLHAAWIEAEISPRNDA
jgi:hypothetical protein